MSSRIRLSTWKGWENNDSADLDHDRFIHSWTGVYHIILPKDPFFPLRHTRFILGRTHLYFFGGIFSFFRIIYPVYLGADKRRSGDFHKYEFKTQIDMEDNFLEENRRFGNNGVYLLFNSSDFKQ